MSRLHGAMQFPSGSQHAPWLPVQVSPGKKSPPRHWLGVNPLWHVPLTQHAPVVAVLVVVVGGVAIVVEVVVVVVSLQDSAPGKKTVPFARQQLSRRFMNNKVPVALQHAPWLVEQNSPGKKSPS